MRYASGGIAHMASVIEDDFVSRETGLHTP